MNKSCTRTQLFYLESEPEKIICLEKGFQLQLEMRKKQHYYYPSVVLFLQFKWQVEHGNNMGGIESSLQLMTLIILTCVYTPDWTVSNGGTPSADTAATGIQGLVTERENEAKRNGIMDLDNDVLFFSTNPTCVVWIGRTPCWQVIHRTKSLIRRGERVRNTEALLMGQIQFYESLLKCLHFAACWYYVVGE